jgi:hypothetical protein
VRPARAGMGARRQIEIFTGHTGVPKYEFVAESSLSPRLCRGF